MVKQAHRRAYVALGVFVLVLASLFMVRHVTAQGQQQGVPIEFEGVIVSINQNMLMVDQHVVDISNVQLATSLRVGVTVRVQGLLTQNTIVIAQTITIIVVQTTPTPTPTATATIAGGDSQPGGECPLSQGDWKNHPAEWPAQSLTLGGQTYTQAELLALLNMEVEGDASLNLAHQLIAAKLNVLNGANEAPIDAVVTQADALLADFEGRLPYGVEPSSSTGQLMVSAAGVLDVYNNALLTPDCGAPTPTATPTSTLEEGNQSETATPTATATSLPTTVVIEGPVTAINITIITIYNINIQLDPEDPLTGVIRIGDFLRVEGDFATSGNTVILVAVTVVFVNVDVYVFNDEVFRDDENCSNPPPDWAPAHGWRRRCEGQERDEDRDRDDDDD